MGQSMRFTSIPTYHDLELFLAQHKYVVLHVRASWNKYDLELEKNMLAIRPELLEQISLASIDFDDENLWPYLKELGVRNIPLLLFYLDGKLVGEKMGLVSSRVLATLLKGFFTFREDV